MGVAWIELTPFTRHFIQPPPTFQEKKMTITLEEILERIQNVLNQDVDTESQDLDLLRHDLENQIYGLNDKE